MWDQWGGFKIFNSRNEYIRAIDQCRVYKWWGWVWYKCGGGACPSLFFHHFCCLVTSGAVQMCLIEWLIDLLLYGIYSRLETRHEYSCDSLSLIDSRWKRPLSTEAKRPGFADVFYSVPLSVICHDQFWSISAKYDFRYTFTWCFQLGSEINRLISPNFRV